MLLRNEVTHASDLDLLTVLIGDRGKATKLFAKAKFSLFALLHTQPHENGVLFCAEHASAYANDPVSNAQSRRRAMQRAEHKKRSPLLAARSPHP